MMSFVVLLKRVGCGKLRERLQNFCTTIGLKESENGVSYQPVLVDEVLNSLKPQKGQIFIDMTFGTGGHTKKLLKADKNIKIFALDRDPQAHQLALKIAQQYPNQIIPFLGKFSDLPQLLTEHNISEGSIDGILFDLGCSPMQLNNPERGFAVALNGPLDMRMDGTRIADAPTAADVIKTLDENDLAVIFKRYGEEKQSKLIARAIIEARFMFRPLKTTQELALLIAEATNTDKRFDLLQQPVKSVTNIFRSLRIFVNNELNELNYGLTLSYKYLKTGGCLAVISYLSLEDRIVKRHIHGIDLDEPISKTIAQKYRAAGSWHDKEAVLALADRKWSSLYKHVILPSLSEVQRNPISRFAKLRAAKKMQLEEIA